MSRTGIWEWVNLAHLTIKDTKVHDVGLTLVASVATSPLAALSNSIISSPVAEKLMRTDNQPNFSREVKLQWAGSREKVSTPVEAEFFLDIPFYRTH
jgi:hypothetical protein